MSGEGVLVTGGAGFIGSNLVDLLLERGHTVYALDDLSTGRMDNLSDAMDHDGFRFIRGDVREPLDNYLTPRNLGDGPPIEVIFHLAARVDVTTSFQFPFEDARVNYLGTLNTMEYALKQGIRKVVLTSSAATYGDTELLPTVEGSPTAPMSPYGLHKLMSEHLLRIFEAQYGMVNTSLRLFNVYGPRQDPGSPYSGVISRFVDRAIRGDPLIIYGDGSQTRDFIYVGDVVEAFYLAYMLSKGGTFNIATGKETTVKDLARIVISLTGSSSRTVHSPARKGEVLRSVADVHAAKGSLEFEAGTDLRTGLAATIKHIRSSR